MKVSFFDKIYLLLKIYGNLHRLPFRYFFHVLLKPAENIRFTELGYLVKYLKTNKSPHFERILDVSSPFILSYILSAKSNVLKTDINPDEKKYIAESNQLSFKTGNALSLSFDNDSFDFVYSVSVIEHIYERYISAVQEMIRVTKTGGLIYLTFPVSNEFREEWLEQDIYSHQHQTSGKVFFQYRFGKKQVDELLSKLPDVSIVACDIFWEKKAGSFDKMIFRMRKKTGIKVIDFLKNTFLGNYHGFTLLETEPQNLHYEKPFGNVSLLLKKN